MQGPGFEEVVGQILAEAEETDRCEDGVFGDARGDELPPGWQRRHAERHARIEAGLARIAAAKKAGQAQQAAKAAEQARRDTEALAVAEQAPADEVATRVAAQQAWEQRWVDAAANPATPLPRGRAPKPVQESVTVARAQQRVDKARARLTHPDTAPRPGGAHPRSRPARTP